ncbi:MAG: peptidoglycan DD-metalloendopeptidase family protein [Patescibacteria group bacterium]|nr:peptidoglycan DD-metalloendopeptidase family protein [Patescibacteria group bacterium]MDE1945733.1 peptidoglycan DD-metalloendopeptidase family protein [Patescibacteria group bacterium]
MFSGDQTISASAGQSAGFNSQNVPLLQNLTNFSASGAVGGGDILVSGDNTALVSNTGPSGTLADVGDSADTGQISKYVVRKGDTLASIAKMFGVSVNTIIWANNVTARSIQPGMTLVILPVSGTMHTVANGDTLASIAKKYKADAAEIAQFNGIDQSSPLAVGDSIIIPDGEGTYIPSSALSGSSRGSSVEPYLGDGGPRLDGYYVRPLAGGVKTQGLHGYNAVDIGTPVGTRVYAAAGGEIIISRSSGWNGGYGHYIAIAHPNGTETVYGHLSANYVSVGEEVYQGEQIGLSGNTGNSTGPHLHFEVRGAYNFMNDASEY